MYLPKPLNGCSVYLHFRLNIFCHFLSQCFPPGWSLWGSFPSIFSLSGNFLGIQNKSIEVDIFWKHQFFEKFHCCSKKDKRSGVWFDNERYFPVAWSMVRPFLEKSEEIAAADKVWPSRPLGNYDVVMESLVTMVRKHKRSTIPFVKESEHHFLRRTPFLRAGGLGQMPTIPSSVIHAPRRQHDHCSHCRHDDSFPQWLTLVHGDWWFPH